MRWMVGLPSAGCDIRCVLWAVGLEEYAQTLDDLRVPGAQFVSYTDEVLLDPLSPMHPRCQGGQGCAP